MSEDSSNNVRHQPDRYRLRTLIVPFLIVAAVLAVAHFALYRLFLARPEERPAGTELAVRPAAAEAQDFETMRSRARAHLDSFGWVDRDVGIAHIPIERAIELVARERSAAGGDKASPPPEDRPSPAGDAP